MQGKIKINQGHLGKITEVTPIGKRGFYTVTWDSGIEEENVSQRVIGEPGNASSKAKGASNHEGSSRKRGRPP